VLLRELEATKALVGTTGGFATVIAVEGALEAAVAAGEADGAAGHAFVAARIVARQHRPDKRP